MKRYPVVPLAIITVLLSLSVSCLAAPGAVGTKIQDVSVTKLSGENTNLYTMLKENGPNRLTLVVIWATWCAYCGQELQDLAEHKKELADMGIDILAVSIDGSIPVVLKYMQRIGTPLNVVVNQNNSIMEALLLRSTPGNFLLTSDGLIALRGPGYQSYKHLLAFLQEAKKRLVS